MISSRFDLRIPFFLLIALALSFMLSLFLLQLFVGVLAILWSIDKIEDRKKALDFIILSVMIFGITRIISIIFSEYPSSSNQSYYKDAIFYLSIFGVSYYLKAVGKQKIKSVNFFFALGAVIISLIGLVLFNLSMYQRAQSFSSGYATFSSYLLCGLAVAITLPYNIKKNGWIYWSISIAIILSAIITSMGRTNIAISMLILGSGVVFKKVKLKPAVVIVFFTFVLTAVSFYNNSSEITNRVEHATALSDRDIIYKGMEKLVGDHILLGFGPRTFHQIFPYYKELQDKGIGSWHNDFVQVYFESGLLGLLAFLAMIIYILYKGFVLFRRKDVDSELRSIVLGAVLAIIALVLSALTAGFIDSPVLSVVFGFLVSIISAIQYFYSGEIQKNLS